MVIKLDSVQPVFPSLSPKEIVDTDDDQPKDGVPTDIPKVGALDIPELIFGAASFSYQYNGDEYLTSTIPVRTVRLALRYGITAFDTSAYYGPSEIVLGSALQALESEFPRSSYQLMTKCGRYGSAATDFDYSPQTIRASINRSLARLHTSYLDTVYLHDIEFVCAAVQPRAAGNHGLALTTESIQYGLHYGDETKIWGAGDQVILDAIAELRSLKKDGIIKNIGITGYPLPALLRIAILVAHTPPYEPLDVVLSYSHLNLQNDTLPAFLPRFRERAAVSQVVTASPINMGLLTASPPKWHPAPPEVRTASAKAHAICQEKSWAGGLPNIALGFAYRKAHELGLPTVVGLGQLREVHDTIRVWRDSTEPNDGKRQECEKEVLAAFNHVQGFSWASP
ncbi:Aldo/keto reductase [Panus rudis PR-1116 ss-1]|nr:Aldo/keto reductase [Panus rudis PR-1116 ss-1]